MGWGLEMTEEKNNLNSVWYLRSCTLKTLSKQLLLVMFSQLHGVHSLYVTHLIKFLTMLNQWENRNFHKRLREKEVFNHLILHLLWKVKYKLIQLKKLRTTTKKSNIAFLERVMLNKFQGKESNQKKKRLHIRRGWTRNPRALSNNKLIYRSSFCFLLLLIRA